MSANNQRFHVAINSVLALVHGQKIVDIKIDQLTRHARNLEFQKKRINILLPFS